MVMEEILETTGYTLEERVDAQLETMRRPNLVGNDSTPWYTTEKTRPKLVSKLPPFSTIDDVDEVELISHATAIVSSPKTVKHPPRSPRRTNQSQSKQRVDQVMDAMATRRTSGSKRSAAANLVPSGFSGLFLTDVDPSLEEMQMEIAAEEGSGSRVGSSWQQYRSSFSAGGMQSALVAPSQGSLTMSGADRSMQSSPTRDPITGNQSYSRTGAPPDSSGSGSVHHRQLRTSMGDRLLPESGADCAVRPEQHEQEQFVIAEAGVSGIPKIFTRMVTPPEVTRKLYRLEDGLMDRSPRGKPTVEAGTKGMRHGSCAMLSRVLSRKASQRVRTAQIARAERGVKEKDVPPGFVGHIPGRRAMSMEGFRTGVSGTAALRGRSAMAAGRSLSGRAASALSLDDASESALLMADGSRSGLNGDVADGAVRASARRVSRYAGPGTAAASALTGEFDGRTRSGRPRHINLHAQRVYSLPRMSAASSRAPSSRHAMSGRGPAGAGSRPGTGAGLGMDQRRHGLGRPHSVAELGNVTVEGGGRVAPRSFDNVAVVGKGPSTPQAAGTPQQIMAMHQSQPLPTGGGGATGAQLNAVMASTAPGAMASPGSVRSKQPRWNSSTKPKINTRIGQKFFKVPDRSTCRLKVALEDFNLRRNAKTDLMVLQSGDIFIGDTGKIYKTYDEQREAELIEEWAVDHAGEKYSALREAQDARGEQLLAERREHRRQVSSGLRLMQKVQTTSSVVKSSQSKALAAAKGARQRLNAREQRIDTLSNEYLRLDSPDFRHRRLFGEDAVAQTLPPPAIRDFEVVPDDLAGPFAGFEMGRGAAPVPDEIARDAPVARLERMKRRKHGARGLQVQPAPMHTAHMYAAHREGAGY